MKILIILQRFNKDPYIYNPDNQPNYNYLLPVGLAYISAYLKREGHKVHVLNLNHFKGTEEMGIRSRLFMSTYDMILLGGLSMYYPHIRDYIKIIRADAPYAKIVVGGGVVTSQPEIMFHLLKPDFVVIGEGEYAVADLAWALNRGQDGHDILGVGYAGSRGEFIQNRPYPPVQNLNVLPLPDYDSFCFEEYLNHIKPGNYIAYEIEDKPRPYPLLASRSCPYNCTFCFHPLGKKYRLRSINNIMKELEYAIPKYKINIVFFYDELFSSDKARLLEFCKRFKELAARIEWPLHWTCNVRVDYVDEEMVRVMKDAGCFLISSGFESYSQTVLDSMKKHTTPEQIRNALTIIARNKIGVQGAFIFGDSAETLGTAQETLDFYIKNQDIIRGGLQLGFIIPFQGSPIYKWCVTTGKIPDETVFIMQRAARGYNYYAPMNLSDRMTDSEFEQLKNMVMTTQLTARPTVRPDYVTERSFRVKCPYCGASTTYSGIDLPRGFNTHNLGCRECHGRFEVVSGLYPVNKFLLKTLGFNRIYRIKKMLGV